MVAGSVLPLIRWPFCPNCLLNAIFSDHWWHNNNSDHLYNPLLSGFLYIDGSQDGWANSGALHPNASTLHLQQDPSQGGLYGAGKHAERSDVSTRNGGHQEESRHQLERKGLLNMWRGIQWSSKHVIQLQIQVFPVLLATNTPHLPLGLKHTSDPTKRSVWRLKTNSKAKMWICAKNIQLTQTCLTEVDYRLSAAILLW